MLKSIGLYFRKIDFLNFAIGAIMPIIVLFIVYSSVKSNIILQDTDFLSLLMNHKGKFIFYFFVSFIEEVIFRGLLFKAIAKDNVKTAIIISSVTFGLGHLLNLVNGSGAGIAENLLQVTGAIAIGFLFVILYYRGGSLFPCIITHSAINITSVFANVVGLTIEKRIIFQLVLFAITITYSFILTKTLPKNQYYDREDN